MATTDAKFDLFIDSLDDYLDSLPDEDRGWAAICICRNAILNVAESHVEELGLVELLKDDLKDFFKFCQKEEKKEGKKTKK